MFSDGMVFGGVRQSIVLYWISGEIQIVTSIT